MNDLEFDDNIVVPKPWGYEYLIYKNQSVAIWILHIKRGRRTSLHCHPNKKTGLVVLSGGFKVSFLNGSNSLLPSDKIMIRQGVFHSSQCWSGDEGILLEVESPVNKQDLIRLKDDYGRTSKYETVYRPVRDIDRNLSGRVIGECLIHHRNIIDETDIPDRATIVTLRGSIHSEGGLHQVLGPADVVDSSTFKRLYSQYDKTTLEVLTICTVWEK